jgi:predicted nuclease of predicted toxin-antitoxin system
MKLLLDMNLSPRWASILEAAGLEAVHWSAVGPGNASDIQIMAFANASLRRPFRGRPAF